MPRDAVERERGGQRASGDPLARGRGRDSDRTIAGRTSPAATSEGQQDASPAIGSIAAQQHAART